MLAIAAPARAADSEYHKVVDGAVVYLGVVPTHIVHDQPGITPMHGGVPGRTAYHHVMIALFEEQTGKRIKDAEVTASVQELDLAAERKRLEPMEIAGRHELWKLLRHVRRQYLPHPVGNSSSRDAASGSGAVAVRPFAQGYVSIGRDDLR